MNSPEKVSELSNDQELSNQQTESNVSDAQDVDDSAKSSNKWHAYQAINYDALYNDQDEMDEQAQQENVDEVSDFQNKEIFVEQNGDEKTRDDMPESKIIDVENVDEGKKHQPHSEINYDALYKAQDDSMQETEGEVMKESPIDSESKEPPTESNPGAIPVSSVEEEIDDYMIGENDEVIVVEEDNSETLIESELEDEKPN